MQYLYIGCAFVSGVVLMKILNRNNDSSAGKDGKKYSTVKLFFILYMYMLLIICILEVASLRAYIFTIFKIFKINECFNLLCVYILVNLDPEHAHSKFILQTLL